MSITTAPAMADTNGRSPANGNRRYGRGADQSSAPNVEWPFTGRNDELRSIHRMISNAKGDDLYGVRGVVVTGAWGAGKTRLATEALRLAGQAGLVSLRATATRAAATVPFGALAMLLPGNHRRRCAIDERAQLHRRAAATLAERAGGRRLVLLVDNAHLLDDESAAFVHQLAMTDAAFLVAATPTGEATPDPIVALWKDGLADRIELRSLDEEIIDELLATVLGGAINPAAVTELMNRSQGNPLFLRELVMGALQTKALVCTETIWSLQGSFPPSDRLVELVEDRLSDLSEAERSLLELASFGGELGEVELTSLANPRVAEALELRALLASRVNGRRLEVRLAHPIYGEVLRARVPAIRARAMTRSLADLVEATGARRREDAFQLASLRLTGGDGRPEVMLAGAVAARRRHDYALAERLASAAMDAGAGFEAALLAARLTSLQGCTMQAERRLSALAEHAATDAQRSLVALARIDNSVVWSGVDKLGILDEAETFVSDQTWRDELQARRLGLILNSRGPRAAADAAAPLLDRAKGGAFVFASIIASYSLSRLGRLEAALDVASRAQASQPATPTPAEWCPWWHAVTRCVALSYAGRFREAEELAVTHHHQALVERSMEGQAAFALMQAVSVGERGRVQTAATRAREALSVHQRLERPLMVRACHLHQALALALGGHAAEAGAALHALDVVELPLALHDEVDLLQARAWACAAGGDLPEARRHLREAAELGEDVGDLVGQAAALHGLARLGRAADVSERLSAVADQIDGDLAAVRAVHTEGLANRDAPRLEEASHAFEMMGADLLAAEAAADAAVARRRAGEARRATSGIRRAWALSERCEGALTPALGAIETRAQLTSAERETALLAAAGRSNKQIAEEQCISVRTVENRLQHVYEKLGISKRTELPEALEP